MAQGRIGLKVQGRKTVVEDIQVGALHERAGDGQALALTTREVRTALGHRGIEPLGLFEHKRTLSNFQRMEHIRLGRVLVAKAQIARHGAREQPCLLRHVGDAPADLVLRKLAQIDAVQTNGTPRGIMEAQQQLCHRGLAGAGRTHNCRGLSAAAGKVQIAQCVLVGIVKAERHMVEHGNGIRIDLGGRYPVTQCTVAVHDTRLNLQHLLCAVQTCGGTRKRQHHHLGHHHKEQDQKRVLQHRRDTRDLHGVGAHPVAANPQHRHLGDVHQKEAGAVETHKQMVDLDGVGRVIAKHLVQALLLVTLLVKRSNDAHAHDVLAQHHVHAIDKALQAHKDRRRVGNRKDRRHQHDRHDYAQKRAHGRVNTPSKDDARHGQERHGQHQLNGLQNRLLDHVDVVERARDHRSRTKLLKIAGRQLERLVVDSVADVASDVGRQARR